jgi:hypothetical protein|eukprot:COSAG01_NODE_3341_length_6230_cov_543.484423_3_plen_89_part_00
MIGGGLQHTGGEFDHLSHITDLEEKLREERARMYQFEEEAPKRGYQGKNKAAATISDLADGSDELPQGTKSAVRPDHSPRPLGVRPGA